MAAFSVFFMQSPSFLSHQRTLGEMRGRSNAETLFGMTAIPTDNHIRQMLDGVQTDHFDQVFSRILKDLDEGGGLEPMRRLGDRTLIALDGSEHFRSRKIHCPQCSTRNLIVAAWREAKQKLGARARLFEHIRTITQHQDTQTRCHNENCC